MTLTEAAEGRNAYGSLRLAAALAVLVSHSFPITTGIRTSEPVLQITGLTLGAIAVGAFFALSGFLITQSFERSSSLASFTRKRVFRIVPGLWVSLLATVVLLAPLASVTLVEYVTSPLFWRYLANGLFLPIGPYLPGMFEDNPASGNVNASLWTLKYEVACYAVVALLGVVGLLRPALMLAGLALAYALMAAPLPKGGIFFYLDQFVDLFRYFACGSLLYLFRARVRPELGLVGLAIGVFVIGGALGFGPWLAPPAIAYATLAGGALLRWRDPPGDYSYGVYVYAFPVQQALARVSQDFALPWLANIMLSLPIVLLLAWLSWRFVEAPAIALGKGRRRTAADAIVGG